MKRPRCAGPSHVTDRIGDELPAIEISEYIPCIHLSNAATILTLSNSEESFMLQNGLTYLQRPSCPQTCHEQRGQAVGHFDVSTVLLCCASTVLHGPTIIIGIAQPQERLRRHPFL